jgi:hypothetical protein
MLKIREVIVQSKSTLSFLHCVIGYTYVMIENKTIKNVEWNIVFYGRRCICYIQT